MGHAGTHLFPATWLSALLQMSAQVRGCMQPYQGIEEETEALRGQKDQLIPELVFPAASYSRVQCGSLGPEEQNWIVEP